MESITVADDQNLKATELRLGLPGTAAEEYHSDKSQQGSAGKRNKRRLSQTSSYDDDEEATTAPRPKAQIVGWPPVRCYRKNFLQEKTSEGEKSSRNYVKVSVDGAPFLRKMDLGLYKGYAELLESMFKLTIGDFSETGGYRKGCSQYEPTYEDKDGDWMLVGDVPWEMFLSTCKRLRIKKQK